MNTFEDLDRASETILHKASLGKITLKEASELSEMIEARRRVLVARDLERRLAILESANAPPEAAK